VPPSESPASAASVGGVGDGLTPVSPVGVHVPADDPQITFYRLQACPFCERVARRLQAYDLDYRSRFVEPMHSRRNVVKREAGVRTVPVIVDERTGVTMAESANVVEYLDATYGEGGAGADGEGSARTDGEGSARTDGEGSARTDGEGGARTDGGGRVAADAAPGAGADDGGGT